MALKTRLLGRDCQIRIAAGGVPLTTLTAIKNFTFQTDQKILEEGYLGETIMRKDSIAEGVSGSFVLNPESPDALIFQKLVFDKAVNRSANETQISITCRLSFPNGASAKLIIPQIEVDPIPFNVGGRDSYVEMTITYKGERYSLMTS